MTAGAPPAGAGVVVSNDAARPPGLSAFDRTVALRDGTLVRMRPIEAGDAPRLVTLYDRLSRDSRYQRFFSVMQRLPPDWARFLADVDYRTRLALVVEAPGDAGALIAVARYESTDARDTVEVAFVVLDGWQDRGLGTVLFSELLRAAAVNGIYRYRAWVLADNRRMLDMIARHGQIQQRTIEQGVADLTFTARVAPA